MVDGSIVSSSFKERQGNAQVLLQPLKQGIPVALLVEDRKLPKRNRAPLVRLFLVPASMFGSKEEYLVVSLETHGCEVVPVPNIDKFSFVRMGLSARLSSAIARELNILYAKE